VLTFGLANESRAQSVEVTWPSGQTDRISNVDTGQTVIIEEGKGIVGSRKFNKRS
jgi:hypothetical protein